MQATVISVQANITKQGRKPYEVHVFTYQSDPYNGISKPPTERNVFVEDRNNPDLAGKVLALTAGDRVELTFSQGEYKNLMDVVVIGQGQQQQQQQQSSPPVDRTTTTPPPPTPYKETAYDKKKDAIQASIIRQVALKAGVEMVKTLLERGEYYPKKVKQAIIADEVIQFANGFEEYILDVNGPVEGEVNNKYNDDFFPSDDDAPQ